MIFVNKKTHMITTDSTNVQQVVDGSSLYNRVGWICPKCNKAISPDVETCPHCNDNHPQMYYTVL